MESETTRTDTANTASMLTAFAGLCLVMSLFFPRFLLALPILVCLGLVLGAFLRKERGRPIAGLVAVGAVGLLFLSEMPARSLSPDASVTYEVSGSATMASVTMTNGQGGTEQHDVTLPWSQSLVGARSNDFVSIAAQNKAEFGDITCSIVVNGVTFKSSTSTGQFGIADCSGIIP